MPIRSYVLRLIAPAVLGIGVFALFYRSWDFFWALRVISEWHFLQPRDAVRAIGQLTGLALAPLATGISLIFPAVALYCCVDAARRPSNENIIKMTIAILAAICFMGVSHLWAWYMVWSVAFAVLLPDWWLARFVIAVGIAAPFTVEWWISRHAQDIAAPILYAAAILWMLATRRVTRLTKRTPPIVAPGADYADDAGTISASPPAAQADTPGP